MEGSIPPSTLSPSYPESSSIPTTGSSSSASVKMDQETEEEEDEVEYLSRFRKLLNALPRAEGIRAGTSPPGAWSIWGEERALLAEEMEGELWTSRASHSSLQYARLLYT